MVCGLHHFCSAPFCSTVHQVLNLNSSYSLYLLEDKISQKQQHFPNKCPHIFCKSRPRQHTNRESRTTNHQRQSDVPFDFPDQGAGYDLVSKVRRNPLMMVVLCQGLTVNLVWVASPLTAVSFSGVNTRGPTQSAPGVDPKSWTPRCEQDDHEGFVQSPQKPGLVSRPAAASGR